MKKDPYETLGVAPDASDKEIRRAHRILARRFHPDAGEGASAERFRDIQEAYGILINPQSRAACDRALRSARRAAHADRLHRRTGDIPRSAHVDLRDIFRHPPGEPVRVERAPGAIRSPGSAPAGLWLLLDLLADWPEPDERTGFGRMWNDLRRF